MDPFRFGGQFGYYADGGPSGVVLCGLRWYDPSVGRFLSRDPEGLAAGQNMLAYCGNDPVNLADPLGLDTGAILRLARWGTVTAEGRSRYRANRWDVTDCGRFVYWCVRSSDPAYPRIGATAQLRHVMADSARWTCGRITSSWDLRPGDIIFYARWGRPAHGAPSLALHTSVFGRWQPAREARSRRTAAFSRALVYSASLTTRRHRGHRPMAQHFGPGYFGLASKRFTFFARYAGGGR